MIVNEYKLYSGTDQNAKYESVKLYHSLVPPQKRSGPRKHYHTSFEISLFRKGRGFYRTKNKTYEIHPGDIFFFSTNEEHSITEISEPDDMLITNIHVDPRFLWLNDNLISSRRFVDIFFNRGDSFENRIAAGTPAAERIKALMDATEQEFINKKDAFEVMVKLHLIEIMICLLRYYGAKSETAGGKTYELTFEKFLCINKAVEYIDSHYTEPITLEKLAKTAGFSKTHFGALFKRMMGMSPWDYINIKRINHARELILTTSLPVETIAAESGYNNTTLFNRIFKKIMGYTPSEVRKDK